MANLLFRFFSPVDRNGPVENAYPRVTELMNTTASNLVSTASADTNESVALTAYNGAVKVAIGAGSPDATTATLYFRVPSDTTLYLSGLVAGHKIAAVDG